MATLGGGLKGSRALVTGASSGIGAATARLIVSEGGRVAPLGRRKEPLVALAEELDDGNALAISADVARPQEVEAAVAQAWGVFGGLDVVVNCAGIAVPMVLEELDARAWQETIDINLSGSFFVSRATGLRMRDADGGVIITVGSELSVMGMGAYVAYCASKAGVLGLTRSLAAELAPTVRVNAICPGPVDTPMLQTEFEMSGDAEAAHAETLERVPLRRLATPEETARAIGFLAVEAPYATGTTLELDGGTTAV